jgi:hypothetical protein
MAPHRTFPPVGPYWKINDLRVQTFLFSLMCDGAVMPLRGTTSYVNGEIYKAALLKTRHQCTPRR